MTYIRTTTHQKTALFVSCLAVCALWYPLTTDSSAEEMRKAAITTVFWVGEKESADNNFISNTASAWDVDWEIHYGGYDDPSNRCGYRPCGFVPKENPFYVALPYNEFTQEGVQKESAKMVPWYTEVAAGELILKNRWVRVSHGDTACYGQWEDVGPYEDDDFAYVFGTEVLPKNRFGSWAGLDISPALRDCLGVSDVSLSVWNFVSADDVPDGPWKEIVTSSSLSW